MIHLEPRHKEIVLAIVKPYAHYDIRAYGSRVKGTQRALSDLDLCVMKPIPFKDWNAMTEAFEESDLPFLVSIAEWSTLSQSFKEAIQKDLLPFDQW